MASNLKRSKRTVGKRLTDIQSRVSTIEKRPAAKALSDAAVATTNLAPGAVGGWMVDADALYIGVKTASGSYSPAGSMTISSDGHISANQFRIDSNGDALFKGKISGGTIDIGDFDTSSFHVDVSGNMWLGGGTYATASFRVSAGGAVQSRALGLAGGSSYVSTISSATYENLFYDGPNNAYARFTIGSTQQENTGFWVGTNSTADSAIREKTLYFTNGVFLDGRAAQGGTYSNVGDFSSGRDGTNSWAALTVRTKNNAGVEQSYVQLFDGNVFASGDVYASAVYVGAKFFKINHPLYPDKNLVHASIEGPTLDVFYRGVSELVNGEIEIELPEYFEALTKKEQRTVLLTPEANNSDTQVAQLAYSAVDSGKFKVFEVNGSQNPSQKFSWTVMATRSDTDFDAVVDSDPLADSLSMHGPISVSKRGTTASDTIVE